MGRCEDWWPREGERQRGRDRGREAGRGAEGDRKRGADADGAFTRLMLRRLNRPALGGSLHILRRWQCALAFPQAGALMAVACLHG